MGLYRLFSYNVKVKYKSYLLSKATFFTVITTLLTLILPLVIAYRSRGLWLKSANYFEQPDVLPTFEYLLVAETEDPSQPIVCGQDAQFGENQEFCDVIQVKQFDANNDKINDMIRFRFHMNLGPNRHITAFTLIIGLDFYIQKCPMQMQSLGIIQKEFSNPVSHIKVFGDLTFLQTKHLPCLKYHIDTTYNHSLFDIVRFDDFVTTILDGYYDREVTSQISQRYSRTHHGQTKFMEINVDIKISEVQIYYVPSLLQELKWAWIQYLALVLIFYWIFDEVKRFVFTNRLLLAWEVLPWKDYTL